MAAVPRLVAVAAALAAFTPAQIKSDDKPREGARQQSRVVVPDRDKHAYESWGYAPVIVTRDGTLYVSGQIVKLEGEGTYQARYAAGFKKTIARIGETLAAAGASLDDIVDITSYHTDLARQLETAVKARMEVMRPPHPSWTAIGTTALAGPDGVTEIRVVAKLPAKN
jgi:enamine deaminase RidA (YjgF/YER057c/UK114 family)